jgi:ATP-binding cassette subfamily B protein/ATP-binding cassette subfamily B protein RtxE
MLDFLKEALRSRKTLFLSATAMTILLKGSVIVPALILGKIIDSLSATENIDSFNISRLLIVLCIAIILQSIFNPLQTYQLASLVQGTLREKSTQWTREILGKEFEQFSSIRLGGLIKCVERGITAHEKLITFFITSGFPLIIELGLIAIIFFYIGGISIFLTLLAISIAYLMIYQRLINWRRPYLTKVNTEEDIVSSRLFEVLQAGKIIKLEQAYNSAPMPLFESYADYAKAATKVASTGAILGSIRILYLGLSTAGLLAWGIQDQLSASPHLTVGSLVAVFSIAGMFLNNFSNLAEAYRTLDQFLVDKKKLHEVLSLDNLFENLQIPILNRLSSLSLSALSPITDRPLHFYPEQSVAIIGPSGAGKTTLLETLAGTLKARRHHLRLNGVQMQSSNIEAYLSIVRYCPQTPVFLEGFFRHSVLFRHDESPALTRALDAFELRELVENRSIAEGANNISGGEAKRLSLLRLINRPGDFNLFDEPTASLDQKTKHRVWDSIFLNFTNCGLICATHDLAALPRFDRVIVIKNGTVIAEGPWSELENVQSVVEIITQLASRPSDA